MKRKVTENQFFSNAILSWYQENPRHLPWRETQDPYKIWLSEIILQQTRVAQGLPYYEAFSKAYPTVQALAEAPMPAILAPPPLEPACPASAPRVRAALTLTASPRAWSLP
jgi:A/G-specific adenine glycosylase